jgi:FtsH-binding integral membrane protein
MLRVYKYMLAGLGVTGSASSNTFLAAVSTDPAKAAHLANGRAAILPGGIMLTSFGHFLFMGLIGIIIASVVGFFWQSAMLQWIISVAGVLIFTGLTAYDTQSIKDSYAASDDDATSGRKAIFGALRLYLDFINLFLMLLRLMGNRR